MQLWPQDALRWQRPPAPPIEPHERDDEQGLPTVAALAIWVPAWALATGVLYPAGVRDSFLLLGSAGIASAAVGIVEVAVTDGARLRRLGFWARVPLLAAVIVGLGFLFDRVLGW